MDTTLELDALCDRDDVAVETETRTVTASEFETARGLENHVTVGIVNGAGELLFVSDGARGWTIPAAPVGPDEPWDAVARRVLESLTGVEAELADPVRVRRVEFRQQGNPDRQRTTYDVLVRSTPVPGRPIADEPTIAREAVTDLVWLDRPPEGGSDGLTSDVQKILD